MDDVDSLSRLEVNLEVLPKADPNDDRVGVTDDKLSLLLLLI